MNKYTNSDYQLSQKRLALLKEHKDTILDFKSGDIDKFKKAVYKLLDKTIEANSNKISVNLTGITDNISESYCEVKSCQAAINVCKDLKDYIDNTDDSINLIDEQIEKQKKTIKNIKDNMEAYENAE